MCCLLNPLRLSAETGRWPQFRGPTGQGLALDAQPPLEWSETRNITWTTKIPGKGHSSPVIWDDLIWVTTSTPDGKKLSAVGLDRATGKIRHDILLLTPSKIEEIHEKNSHASTTPVLAEGRLYAHFGTYGAACIDTTTGEILWKNEELQIEHQGGPGSSPVLWEKLLIVTCDGADQQYVAALDVDTGKIKWKRPRSAPYRANRITKRAFATPLLITHDGKPQLISPAADQLHAYHPGTGEELWHVRYTGFSTIPCPSYEDGVIFMCTGFFKPEMAAIKVNGTGNVTDTHLNWRVQKGVPDTPSPIVHQGRVYIVSDKGIGTCIEAKSGKVLWTRRLEGNFSASPLLAGEHLFYCSEEGTTRVLKLGPTPDKGKINKLPGRIMASPAALGKELYIRTTVGLFRVEEGAPAKSSPVALRKLAE
ncbi:MAG: PQQ-binding-like beta-propeller repeat protein [Planctomycetales bacterium]